MPERAGGGGLAMRGRTYDGGVPMGRVGRSPSSGDASDSCVTASGGVQGSRCLVIFEDSPPRASSSPRLSIGPSAERCAQRRSCSSETGVSSVGSGFGAASTEGAASPAHTRALEALTELSSNDGVTRHAAMVQALQLRLKALRSVRAPWSVGEASTTLSALRGPDPGEDCINGSGFCWSVGDLERFRSRCQNTDGQPAEWQEVHDYLDCF